MKSISNGNPSGSDVEKQPRSPLPVPLPLLNHKISLNPELGVASGVGTGVGVGVLAPASKQAQGEVDEKKHVTIMEDPSIL